MDSEDVRVYHHPNKEIRSYLTQDEITNPLHEAFENPLTEDEDRLAARLGSIGTHVVKEILALSGVAQIRFKPKEIRVRKIPDVTWDDLEPEILRIVERAVRRRRMRVLKR